MADGLKDEVEYLAKKWWASKQREVEARRVLESERGEQVSIAQELFQRNLPEILKKLSDPGAG